MSSGTNSERITQNNTKLAELKTKADNLPDYQDIELIYGHKLYNCEVVNKATSVSQMTFDSNFEPELGITINTSNRTVNFYKVLKDTEGEYMTTSLISTFNFTEFPIRPAVDGGSVSIATYNLTSPHIKNSSVIVVTYARSSNTCYTRVNVIPYKYQNNKIIIDTENVMTSYWSTSDLSSVSVSHPVSISNDGKFFKYGPIWRDTYYDSYDQQMGAIDWDNHKISLRTYSYGWSRGESYFVNNNTLIEYYLDPQNYSKPDFKCLIVLRILKNDGTDWISKTFSNGAIAVSSDLKYVLYKNSSTAGNNVFHLNTLNINYENSTITETLYKTFTIPNDSNNVLINQDYTSTCCPIITLGDNILAMLGGVVSGDTNTYLETYKIDLSLDVPLVYENKYIIGRSHTYFSFSVIDNNIVYSSDKLIRGVPEYSYVQGIKYNTDYFYKYIDDGIATAEAKDVLSSKSYIGEEGVPLYGTMPNNGQLNYTPSISQQTIPAGYTSGGTISAVTSAIDNNIQAENIKKGITILGITGTYEGDTSL